MTQRLPTCRMIIESEPRSGAWNMALDEALLQSAIDYDECVLRWYRWDRATASLGYFQGHAELQEDLRVAALPVVRRLSGGGTIVHDDEWTYGLVLPAQQRVIHQPHELYDLVHTAIVAVLQSAGFEVALRGATHKAAPEPVLCFSRQDAHDVVSGGYKVLGSAQRRRKGALLQHGSLVLRASPAAPQYPGLIDLNPQAAPLTLATIQEVSHAIAIHLAEQARPGGWEDSELQLAAQYAQEQPARIAAR